MPAKKRSVSKPNEASAARIQAVVIAAPPSPPRRRLWLLLFSLFILVAIAFIFRSQIASQIANSAGNIKYLHNRQNAERLLSVAQLFAADAPQIALTRARWERRDGNLEASLELLERAIDDGAEQVDLDLERTLFAAQQNPSPATDKKLVELFENYPGHRDDICLAYSLGYLSHRRYDSAIMLLKGWSDDDPVNPLPLALLGTMHAEQENTQEAESHFRSALHLEPGHPIATFGLAELLSEHGKLEESLTYYETAARAEFNSQVSVITGWANALQALGKLAQARAILDSALTQYPEDSSLKTQRANLALEDGDFDLVVNLLQPEIDRGSLQQTVNYAYATAHRRLGNLDVANRHFQIAAEAAKEGSAMLQLDAQLAEQPNNIELKYEIGWRNLRYGNPNEGLFWLSQVLKVDPDHPKAHLALAEYYTNLNQATKSSRKLADLHRRKANAWRQKTTED